jgi:hypothetical protein
LFLFSALYDCAQILCLFDPFFCPSGDVSSNLKMALPLFTANRTITQDTVSEAAEFFRSQLGDEKAVEYLKDVLGCFLTSGVNGSSSSSASSSHAAASTSNKRSRNDDHESGAATEQESFSLDAILLRDATDSMPMTTILQIPEELTLVSFIIGKGGCNLSMITSMTGCKVQVEKVGTRPADTVRNIIFIGTVMSTFQAVVQVRRSDFIYIFKMLMMVIE